MEEKLEVKDLHIITGLSGAGKSTALRVFEDLRYFAVDGLPVRAAPQVAEISRSESMRVFKGIAMCLDVRQKDFLDDFSLTIQTLKESGFNPKLIFLEANTQTLIKRYAQTRRPHPLETRELGLEKAINSERRLLKPLRDKADLIIDSTSFSIHDLRRQIQQYAMTSAGGAHQLGVKIFSFGFKHGLPPDADFVFDLRFLPNPYFVEHLRTRTGKDKEVSDYVFATKEAKLFKDKLFETLLVALDCMEKEGRYRVTIALGCTGGQHRSVAMGEKIAHALQQAGYPVEIEHRELSLPERKPDQ